MQQRSVLHRDIKLENILIDDDGHLLLCDFGLSCQGSKASATYLSGSHRYVGLRGNLDNACCGTWELLPPEALAGRPYGYELDLWSWGIAMYLMAMGTVNLFDGLTYGIYPRI
ncbi:kinase-like protein, partial [Coniophora puteana RWD-64-598 SS2]